jgi:protoheme IX farnesyltransferase
MESHLDINLEHDEALAAHVADHSVEPLAHSAVSRLNDFYELTKPRMNLLVVLTTAVGFYMASPGAIEWLLLLHTALGTALTAAGAAVLNQLVERDFDKLMPRTKNRPLPAGRVSPLEALLYGTILGISGVGYLVILVNPLTALLGAVTLLSYLFIYTPMKRWTTLNTVIGAVPGAIPPMMGVTAVTGVLSVQAISLFAILFFWQMPPFLAIAILYRQDYAAGGFKMLPVVDEERGNRLSLGDTERARVERLSRLANSEPARRKKSFEDVRDAELLDSMPVELIGLVV